MRLAPHDGQKPLLRQLNATILSAWHDSHWTRRNPCSKQPATSIDSQCTGDPSALTQLAVGRSSSCGSICLTSQCAFFYGHMTLPRVICRRSSGLLKTRIPVCQDSFQDLIPRVYWNLFHPVHRCWTRSGLRSCGNTLRLIGEIGVRFGDDRVDGFTPAFVRNADHGCIGDVRVLHRHIFDLCRVERRGMFTSGIISQRGEHLLALFFTGRQHAGENLNQVLAHRSEQLAAPIQMCDALLRNVPAEFETVLSNCLSHGRRQFVTIVENFPEQCLTCWRSWLTFTPLMPRPVSRR